eukprot:123792_1
MVCVMDIYNSPHAYLHEDVSEMMKSFRYEAHPMGMLITVLSALGTIHPEANPTLSGQRLYSDIQVRNKQINRCIGSVATISASAYRHRVGRPYVYPSHQNLTC